MRYIMDVMICMSFIFVSASYSSTASPEAEFTITELNRWAVPEGTYAMGLDYIESWTVDHVIAYASAVDDKVYWMSAETGSSIPGGWDCDTDNNDPFGVAHIPSTDAIHVNDCTINSSYFRNASNPWDDYATFCGSSGRGMDYSVDDNLVFEVCTDADPGNYSWYVATYQPGSSSGSVYQIDCYTAEDWRASGIALYPMLGGNTGLAVTMYSSDEIRFFEYPGHAGEVYYGYGELPYSSSIALSWGITYADELGTFFHAWRDGATGYVSQLEIGSVSLERTTWGQIKTIF